MLEGGVSSDKVDNLTAQKMRTFCNMVGIDLPKVASGLKTSVPAVPELTYSGHDQDTQEFWDGTPQIIKEVVGKKAKEEVQRLIDIMRGVLVKQGQVWSVSLVLSVSLDLSDVTRAVDAALNGGNITTLVAGLNVSGAKLGIRREIARALLEDVRAILAAMPNLSDDIGRNQIASAIHCALNKFPPPTDLVKQAAIVILRRANVDFMVLLRKTQWFRDTEA
ncbi:hypothetical protein KBC40_02570 [Patescibacteria group bacterium]|nr:hypothetical protein [Patescibacteria group bacterium]